MSKDLKPVIYCTAIRYGGEKEWDFLWEQYLKSNIATQKSTLLHALGCTRELWLLNRFLEWSIKENSGIRRQDCVSVFYDVADNNIGYYAAKTFLWNNVKDIYQ